MRRAAFLFLLTLIPLFGFSAGSVSIPRKCTREASAHRAPCCPPPAPTPAPAKDCCRYSQPIAALSATAVDPVQRRAAPLAILIPAAAPFITPAERAVAIRPALHPPPLTRAPLILPLRV